MNTNPLPIDINYSKLLEWLVDRKKLSPKWNESIRKIQDALIATKKVNTSGNAEAIKILESEIITYFDCLRLLQILEQDEGASAKNIFGQYNKPELHRWNLLLRAWAKDNIYLGECGRLLIQWTTYECPAMKKILTNSEKQLSDLNRKIGEYEKIICNCEKLYAEQCKQWGIEGKVTTSASIRMELHSLTKELTKLYDDIESRIQQPDFVNSVNYCLQFIKFLFQVNDSPEENTEQNHSYLPQLQSLIRGDRRTIQSSTNSNSEIAAISEEITPTMDLSTDTFGFSSEAVGAVAELNWDIGVAEIDWDATDVTSIEAGVGVVDWGEDGDISSGTSGIVCVGGTDPTDAAVDCWDISDTLPSTDTYNAQDLTTSTTENNTATKTTISVSLLSDPKFRELLFDDFETLKTFLNQRINLLSNGEDLSSQLHNKLSNKIFITDFTIGTTDEIQNYLHVVNSVETQLRKEKMKSYQMILEKKSYLDRSVRTILAPIEKADRIKGLIAETRGRLIEATATCAEVKPRLDALRKACKSLKEDMEKAISVLLSGREVHIVGDINTI